MSVCLFPRNDFDFARLSRLKRGRTFFYQDSITVARKILGDFLVYRHAGRLLVGKIVEVECYPGIDDDASHSFRAKKTPRTSILYERGGVAYVYTIYGRFFCFNIVVSLSDDPQAVFIRALEPIRGISVMERNRKVKSRQKLTSGPCRWTQAFGIGRKHSGMSLSSKALFISRGSHKTFTIQTAPRVGVEYARAKNALLRFYIRGNAFVSKV